MMETRIESTMHTTAIFSEDKAHRFLLRKTWKKDKPKAMVIMIYPCSNDIETLDLTTMLVLNNLSKLDYGTVDLLNIFSKIDANLRKEISEINNPENDRHITESAEKADAIIICWGKRGENSKRANQKEKEVFTLLKPFADKVFVLEDERGGIQGLHPLTPSLRSRWKLAKFELPEQQAQAGADGKEQADK